MTNGRVLVLGALLVFSACATTKGLNSKDYKCAELRQLIQTERSMTIQGLFGATTVHASPRSCRGIYLRAQRSTWKSSDKTFCAAGFTCQYFDRTDDD